MDPHILFPTTLRLLRPFIAFPSPGWAQVCCRFGIFTHVLVLSRGPSPVPYLCITNIGSHTLLDPSNILSVGHSKKFSLPLTALMAPLGRKIPPSVVEYRSTCRLRVGWEYQPCYSTFTDLLMIRTMISTKDFVLPVSESCELVRSGEWE